MNESFIVAINYQTQSHRGNNTMNMNEMQSIVWMDGEFIENTNAKVHFFTSTLHYGSSVFEGTRAYNGKIFKEKEHNIRLYKSAEIIQLKPKISLEEFTKIQREVMARNNLTDCYIRPLIWFGPETMGLKTANNETHMAIAAWEWGTYFSEDLVETGLRLTWSEWRRPDPKTAPSVAKAGGLYMICSMSKNQAVQRGYDDALMLDYRGYIAECTAANVFFIRGKNIITPKADCFLNGITRQTIINEIAPALGYNIIERHILPEELGEFEQCFITGTATEVMPVGEVDEIKFKVGKEVLEIRNSFRSLTIHPNS